MMRITARFFYSFFKHQAFETIVSLTMLSVCLYILISSYSNSGPTNSDHSQRIVKSALAETIQHSSSSKLNSETNQKGSSAKLNSETNQESGSSKLTPPFFTRQELDEWRYNINSFIDGSRSLPAGPRMHLLQKMGERLRNIRQQCTTGLHYVPTEGDSYPEVSLRVYPYQKILFCPIAKAGCNYMKGYLAVLSKMYPGDPSQLAKSSGNPPSNRVYVKDQVRSYDSESGDYLSYKVVRHPIQRLLSAYCNKVIQFGHTLGYKPAVSTQRGKDVLTVVREQLPQYKLPMEFKAFNSAQSSGSGLFIRETSYELPDSPPDAKGGETAPTRPLAPTFPEFVIFAAVKILTCEGDPACLRGVDAHFRPQSISCDPCRSNFDVILKIENLTAEFNDLREHFHLPSVDEEFLEFYSENQARVGVEENKEGQTVVKLNSSGGVCAPYEYFMAQLSQLHLDLLYTAYYTDLLMYGYNFDDPVVHA